MKIIALLPVKNEEWILETCLRSLKELSDEIIIFDDGSTDNSKKIMKRQGAVIVVQPNVRSDYVDMSFKRRILLEEGRRRGGTHFIWLDADEAFAGKFLKNGREIISRLKPGEKLMLKWITLWKSVNEYRIDGLFRDLYKDFIVADSPELNFEKKFLSEGRTPGKNNYNIRLDERDGVVLHFQFVNWERNQLKQAWYRCIELLQGNKDPRRINNTYRFTLDSKCRTAPVDKEWISNLALQEKNNTLPLNWHETEVLKMFEQYGIERFESLEIWHIKSFYDEFIARVHRRPKPMVFPMIIIKLNDLKNVIKRKLI
jgi:glycosyltransferase involved in cell wall biosynthesis